MTTADPKCPSCREPMERGYLLDRGHGIQRYSTKWVEGEPVASRWSGLRLKDRVIRQVVSYRCTRCGLLLNFARGPEGTRVR